MICRGATLDDWERLKELWVEFSKTRFVAYIQTTMEEVGNYLVASLAFRDRVGMLVLEVEDGQLIGLCTMAVVAQPQIHKPNCPLTPGCFIHIAYIAPSYTSGDKKIRTPYDAGKKLSAAVDDWCRERNISSAFGHVRLDGNFNGFLEKYGFEKWHYTIGREVDYGVRR